MPYVRIIIVLATCFALNGCGFVLGQITRESTRKTQEESQVVASLARYKELAIEANPDRLADMFAANGELSHNTEKPCIGQAQIQMCLSSSIGRRIQEYELQALSTTVEKGSAKQSGTYSQVVVTSSGTTIKASGEFEASWQHQPDGRWLLTRMHTTSATTGGGA